MKTIGFKDMWGHLTVFFWTVTYVLIIIGGIKHRGRKMMMPLFSGSLNLAWEVNALFKANFYYGHVIWMLLDILIYGINISGIKKRRQQVLYLIASISFVLLLRIVFSTDDGMLVSVFIIDLIMAIEYIFVAKRTAVQGTAIAVFRLLGDLCAFLGNRTVPFVAITGTIVFLCNLFYLSCCLEVNREKRK